MAKLSAYGRKELHRLKRKETEPDGETVMVVMSDRTVLQKFVRIHEDGRRESSSWKKAGKVKPGHIDFFVEKAQEKLGYSLV